MIKCNNVQEQAQDLSGQIFTRWQELLQSGDFILGDEVLAFEAWMSGRVGAAGRTPSASTQARMRYFWRCAGSRLDPVTR